MSDGERIATVLIAVMGLVAMLVLVPVALMIGGGVGLMMASGLWH